MYLTILAEFEKVFKPQINGWSEAFYGTNFISEAC